MAAMPEREPVGDALVEIRAYLATHPECEKSDRRRGLEAAAARCPAQGRARSSVTESRRMGQGDAGRVPRCPSGPGPRALALGMGAFTSA